LLDFAVASVLLVGMMIYYHAQPGWGLLLCPFVILLMVMLTVGMSMFVAALNVRYRDVKYVLPFVVQLWMFATPVIYPISMVPDRYRPIVALNPCTVIIEGFRACLFPILPVDFKLMAISTCMILVVFALGVTYFHRMEKSFADII
jgi:lipopolysaccharide transport system permease protein